ncbi:MAG: hypothetical protein ACP5M9_02660 [Candidatus Micrarchaeia archaeon]
MVPKRDELLTETSLQTLHDRYFIKEVNGKENRLETPINGKNMGYMH